MLVRCEIPGKAMRALLLMYVDSTCCLRSNDLQVETASLRERIKHLNDMVFCQQRKVKAMIEEVRRADLSILGIPSNTDLLFYPAQ